MTIIDRRSGSICASVLLALGLLVLSLGIAAPASAAKAKPKPCGDRVIDDWYDNGRVDGEYKLHCYDDAIENLPRDIAVYSSAKEDIQRAMAARMAGRPAPPASTDPTPGGSTGTDTAGGAGTGSNTTKGSDGSASPAGPVDTASASSLPLPLLILGGLALLLIAAGSAGYLTRRLQARRVPPPLA